MRSVRNDNFLKWWLIGFFVAMILLVASCVVEPAMVHAEGTDLHCTDGAIYQVTNSYIRVRSKASTKSKIKGKVHEGDFLLISEIKNDFGKISRVTHGDRKTRKLKGWVYLPGYTKRITDGWVKESGKMYYKRKIAPNKQIVIQSNRMYKVNKHLNDDRITSKGGVIAVCNKNQFLYMVFEVSGNEWKPRYCVPCKTGMEGWATPAGIHKVNKKIPYFDKNGHRYWFGLKFWGGCIDHSMACKISDDVIPIETEGGYRGTHGCISKHPDVARWFYNRAEIGTKIVVYTESPKWKAWWK